MAEQRRIILADAAVSEGYGVTVEPPPEWNNFNAERPTHRAALLYSQSLRTLHGWRIVDQTGEAS